MQQFSVAALVKMLDLNTYKHGVQLTYTRTHSQTYKHTYHAHILVRPSEVKSQRLFESSMSEA